jgi:hypothetical protein
MTSTLDRWSASQRLPARENTADWRNILLCAALFLLAVAATNPVLEMGVNDDFSYTHIAREFAATGRLEYNGWAVMPLVPQIAWAAAFIKLFGFSFLAVRLSTVVLGLFLTPVLYRLGRESGLAPSFAAYATLLTTLSPLTLPEAVSFMSDVPALFLFALCFLGGIKAWKAATAKASIRWAGLVALAGVLSGLDRQVYWLAPLGFLPAVAWVQRRKKPVAIGLGALWLGTVLALVSFVLWFQAKPYTLVEHSLEAWEHAGVRFLAIREFSLAGELALTAALVLLPLLAGYVAPGFRAVSRQGAALAAAGALATGFAMSRLLHRPAPWLGNILTETGILNRGPLILGPAMRELLTGAVLLAGAGCGLALWKHRRNALARLRQDPAAPAAMLGFLFAGAALAAIFYRSASAAAFDRYAIPFLPLAAIPLLRHYQTAIARRIGRLQWAMLALFACYGVATTHDAFAAARARLSAAQALERRGIPRTGIRTAIEYDGWTQLESTGYLNNRQIENPAGAYRPVKCSGPAVEELSLAPAIHARYFVVLARLPELEDASAAPVGYTTWLPPAQRQVFTQTLPDGGYAGCR